MLSPKNAISIFLYVNIVSWLLLLAIKLIALMGFSNQTVYTFNFYLRGLLLNLFLLIIFFYFNGRFDKVKRTEFVDLLTNLFLLGLITNTIALVIQFGISFLKIPPITESKSNLMAILYHLNIALVTIFLTQAFFYWKRLVLFDKNKTLSQTWNIFEYLLLVSLLFNFFELDFRHIPFIVSLGVLLLMGFALSLNLKWVAYLNAKEKWQSILLLLFIGIFAYYFFYTVLNHSGNYYVITDLMQSVYVLAMFIFVIFYTVFSLLVILFNLPTSSVFEKKIEEVISFQKLAQSLQKGEKEDQVYEILLDSAINSVGADAAWLEVRNEKGGHFSVLNRDIDEATVNHIKRSIQKVRRSSVIDNTFSRLSGQKSNHNSLQNELMKYDFESILLTQLSTNEKSLGTLVLLKKVKDGFDDEQKNLINTFTRQASISIENFRLLAQTIETERYKEELKIAQRVQESLLPKNIDIGGYFEIKAFSESAYEVGGDYYDIYQIDDKRAVLIIGDVSGKGTSAAFHMSQMKGIFQALARLNFSPAEFLDYANQALSNCLEKSAFMTITIMLMDAEKQELNFARAGHCPTLYYQGASQKAQYYKGKGLGLGILRENHYAEYIEPQIIQYQMGDLILLYTDGIIEALNDQGEEYGYDRLKEFLEQKAHLSTQKILDALIHNLEQFCNHHEITDDHTAILVRFKQPN
jgi:phosphoserine phosphatase RsbU/P